MAEFLRRAPPVKIAIVGGGWAGLAAAVRAVSLGHQVTLLEMAPCLGGRARTAQQRDRRRDNGQHILIGAYSQTLGLMRQVGVDPALALHRMPLRLVEPGGNGLALDGPSSPLAFAAAVIRHRGWSWTSRFALLRVSAGWAARRFNCAAGMTVETLTRSLPREVRDGLIEPLCVAALNTPASRASARVFLRVLKDALMGEAGGADLMLPRLPLTELLPRPAAQWLQVRGAAVKPGQRVTCLTRLETGWQVGGQHVDGVILATSAKEAARLAAEHHPQWAREAAQIPHEPITTVYLSCPGARPKSPMSLLPRGPAQFAFDLDALGHPHGGFAFVISAADDFKGRGRKDLAEAVVQQALDLFPAGTWPQMPQVETVYTEQRATFRCEPGVSRPADRVAPGLWAAGDYVLGPYPSTLEGAVRSGQLAVENLVCDAFAMQNSASRGART